MHIDIHIAYAVNSVVGPQRLDRDAQIVEDAEAGGAIAAGMVQPANGLKRGATLCAHNMGQTVERRTNHYRTGFVDAGKYWCVSVVQILAPIGFRSQDIFDITGRMESLDLCAGSRLRRADRRPLIQLLRNRLLEEGALSVHT